MSVSVSLLRPQKKGIWYHRWKDLGEFLKAKPDEASILRRVYGLIEDCNGHHYNHIAGASEEALERVIKEAKCQQ